MISGNDHENLHTISAKVTKKAQTIRIFRAYYPYNPYDPYLHITIGGAKWNTSLFTHYYLKEEKLNVLYGRSFFYLYLTI